MSDFEFNQPDCVCGGTTFFVSERNGVKIARCLKCGVIAQANPSFMTDEQYINFYKNEYPPVKKDYV